MDKWEQIFFAVMLAIFGALLFKANKKIGAVTVSSAGDTGATTPWYLNYNSAAGFTGPVNSTGVTSAGLAMPMLAQLDGGQGNATAWQLFPQYAQV